MELFSSDETDSTDTDEEHVCSDYELVERGDWELHGTINADMDGITVFLKQHVTVACTECGDRLEGYDNNRVKEKFVSFELSEIHENEDEYDFSTDPSHEGKFMDVQNVDGL